MIEGRLEEVWIEAGWSGKKGMGERAWTRERGVLIGDCRVLLFCGERMRVDGLSVAEGSNVRWGSDDAVTTAFSKMGS